MTVPHLTPAVQAPTVAAAVGALRHRGLRLSSARRVVLEGLFAAGRPITAEEIADGVGGRVPPSDLASVYRNLEVLERLGLVRHLHLGHGPSLYAPSGDRHELVACERCGASAALAPRLAHALRDAVRAATGFEARFCHQPLPGLCPRCYTATTTED
jgi:Fur family transcriptional regulator, ferric uptake regulator